MKQRPYVLSIAGFDPSGGAGIAADIKTFEQHKVCGLSVVTSVTYQHESYFEGVKWLSIEEIRQQLDVLKLQYQPHCIKIGLVESFERLVQILQWIKWNWPEAFVIWDPILTASAGFPFHNPQQAELQKLIPGYINLITPNIPEYNQLFGEQKAQQVVDEYNCGLLLKGGHSTTDHVTDYLYQPEESKTEITSQKVSGDWQKHGTGCVLSAAIGAQMANDVPLSEACKKAHFYVKQFIASDEGLLGFHPNPDAL